MVAHDSALEKLRDCLATLPPVELKGMALLRERPPDLGFFPPLGASRGQITEAVTELVAYTTACQHALQTLARLTPIPLLNLSFLDYGL
ncbi:MAG: hypothetical protein J0M33_29045 [Anaerolineae bacterium]|nr:hypothetical protein [Anaerolineae bacterium]